MLYPRLLLILVILFGASLSGCSRYVQKTDYKPIREVPYDAAPTPILFRDVELLLPVGMDVGFESDSSRFCGWPRYPVSRTVMRDAIDKKFIKQTFHDVLEAQGYDVVGSLDIAYDLEDEEDRAEYSIKAKIKDVQLEMCHNEPDNFMIFFTTRRGTDGEMFLNVEWTVYDALRRTVVYKTQTQGYTDRRVPNQEGLTLMFTDAFEMAAHNLGTDKNFHDLIVSGINPQDWRNKPAFHKEQTEREPQFDHAEKITIKNKTRSNQSFTKNIESKRRAAVMVQKFGHASGFFISPHGHILTTADAVGDGLRTRIVTANKEEKLSAEIIRIDRVRNVALLRLENVPEKFEIATLPLRPEWPDVGEELYTIGTPKDYRKMMDTMTHGIVSAHRKNMKINGVKQNFIQTDLEMHKGSNGGPVIDKNGNIVGIAMPRDDDGIGLNYFIPVGEALAALDIELTGANGKPVSLLP